MSNRAGNTIRVPKRRGSGESDDHWLENLDLERGASLGEEESPDAEAGDEPDEELEEDIVEADEEEKDERG